MFAVLHRAPGLHVIERSERFHFQELLVGEGLVAATEIGLLARVLRAGALDEKVGTEQIARGKGRSARRGWKPADVGPRVIRYGFIGGQNVFKEFEEQMGKSGESTWQPVGPPSLTADSAARYRSKPASQCQ
jgi:hypothetical protein